jgi:hypothetical protein
VSIDCQRLPCSIKALLKGLTGKTVTIITDASKETVNIKGVVGGILISSLDRCIQFTLIECICSVITSCDNLIDATFATNSPA